MTPYYDERGITIFHGDCREILPTLPANSVDLIVTDPPYGIRWQSSHRQVAFSLIAGDESQDAAVEGVRLALRVLRNKRHIYVFGRYDFSALPLASGVELIWDKLNTNPNGASAGHPWARQHEYIQFHVHISSQANRASGDGQLAARLRRGTVLRYLRPNGVRVVDHPTEKPVLLLRELIESSSRFGETVLDPFMGVGSTLVAARREDRKAIGIEIEEHYCEIAARRLQQNVFAFDEAPV